jgi:hypothetical protein
VPKERLCATDKWTYQPTFISFGPYHRGENATEEMRGNEQGKLCILSSIIQGGGPTVLTLTQAVASMETDARRCYEGDVQMEHDAFCKMLLLDAVQLILLLQFLGQKQEAAASPESSSATASIIKTRDINMTVHDLMMLENQIPFFLVEKVHELCCSADIYANVADGDGSAMPVDQLAWRTIKAIMSDVPPASNDVGECKHLVHLCHVYLKPTISIADEV